MIETAKYYADEEVQEIWIISEDLRRDILDGIFLLALFYLSVCAEEGYL